MKFSSHALGNFFLAFALVLVLPSLMFGQGSNGTINGTVTDATGAVIPGAQVTIMNAETGVTSTIESGVNGTFALPVAAGLYNVTVESDGFKQATVNGLRVNVASHVAQTFALEIGALTEVVEVTAAQLQIQTTSGSVGATVQVEQIQELPLPNRDIFNLVNLVPGAFRSESNGNMSIGGGRTRSTGSYIDGINNTRGGLGVQNVEMSPPVDSMQEFKVEVNSMGAKYGRSSSGVVTAVTRSGSNNMHGSLYHFIRNDAFDAAGWQNDSKPKLRHNNGGGSIGLPIVKNKTFLFYNLDVFREAEGQIRTRSVGLPEWRNGDFSTATRNAGGKAKLVKIYDPQTRLSGPVNNGRDATQFPNNMIPSSRFDSVAVQALGFLPNPNRTPNNLNNNAGNWREQTSRNRDRNYHTFKLDHNFSDKYRTFVRMILTSPDKTITGYSQGYGVADQNGLDILNVRQNWGWSQTYTFSPTFFVTGLIGLNRVSVDRKSGDCCDTNYAQQFGIPGLEQGGEVFPRFNIQGGRVPVNQFGAVGNANRFAVFTNFDFEANFTKVKGDHTITFGAKYTAFQGNEVSRQRPSGSWRIQGNLTRFRPTGGGRNNNTGVNLADFLLGHIWNLDTRVAPGIGKRIKYYSGYVQDDWKVNPRLTLNLGFRYEIETPITEVGGRVNGFCQFCPHPLAGQNGIRENAIGKVLFRNRDGTGKYLWNTDKNNWAPRFGFALRLKEDDSLVLRGGFGVFFGNPYDRNTIQPGRAGFDNIFRIRGGAKFFLRDGVPAGALDDIPESELNGGFGSVGTRFPTSTIQFWDQARKMPYSQNFNLTLQTRWKGVLWDFGFLGALARQQSIAAINLNQIRPEDLPAANAKGANIEDFRQWSAFSGSQDLIQLESPNWGVSNYYALTFKSEKRYQNGLGWTIAYTHTQWIDNIRFIGDADTFGDDDNPQNIFDFKSERAKSVNGLPHRIVMAPILDLPFGRGRKWGQNWGKVLNAVAGGWQLATVGTLRTGGYMGVTVDGGPNLRGDAATNVTLRPNLTLQGFDASNQGQAAEGIIGLNWLNAGTFENPDPFTLGNAARTLPGLRGPWRGGFDVMLAKNFRWGENWRAQFRWEAFDFTNTPAFQIPNTSFGSGNFGVVTSTLPNSRRIMQLGLRITF